VVIGGETMMLPEESTVPTPWLIYTDVAFVTLQFKVADSPELILDGLALNELITGKPVGAGGVSGTGSS